MKRALIVAATGGFLHGFLTHDMEILQSMGYEVHCAANRSPASVIPSEFFASMGVTFHHIDFSSTSPLSRQSIKAFKQYRKLYKEYRFDLVHVHTPIPGAIVRVANMFDRKKGCKVVYTTHGLTFPKGSSFKTKLIYGGIEWMCAWLSDGIITINREDYAQIQKMHCKKVYHINGVGVNTKRYHDCDIDRDEYRESLGLKKEDIAVLQVGELSVRKNHRVIMDALSLLDTNRYVFLICGKAMTHSGTYDFLQQHAKDKHIRVRFLGFRTDIPELNHCADIAVLPSLREGLGLAGIEALASGVPVVGSAVQGIRDYVVDGVTGYLCNPTDAEDFAEKIKKLSEPHHRASMSKACVAKAEEFSTEISYRQMEEIYQQLLCAQE